MSTAVVMVCGIAVTIGLVRSARRVAAGMHAQGIGTRTRWKLPAPLRVPMERALAESAIEIAPEELCELTAAGALGATVLVSAVSPRLAPVVAIGAVVAVPIGLRLTRGRARAQFEAALPEVLERIASGLRGGASLDESLEAQAAAGPVAVDLRRIRARQALGLELAAAVAAWPEERALPSVRAAAGALAVASTMGGRSASAIDGLASSLREHRSAVADARALSAQARLSALVVGAAPIGYLLFSAVVDPASVDVLVGTRVGQVCLIGGLALEVAGVVWMRRIVGREE